MAPLGQSAVIGLNATEQELERCRAVTAGLTRLLVKGREELAEAKLESERWIARVLVLEARLEAIRKAAG